MSAPNFGSLMSMPFDTQIELPNELWMEPWLDNIEDFSFDGSYMSHGETPFYNDSDNGASLAFDVSSGHESPHSGSIGYLSMPNSFGSSFESSAGGFGFNDILEAAKSAHALSALDIVQTMPAPGLPQGAAGQKQPAGASGDAKLKKSSKAPKAAAPTTESVDPNKYKTRLCRNFKETGKCPYGETCVYAHGAKEMRCKEDNEAAVQSLTKLADHLSRQRTNRFSAPRPAADNRFQLSPQLGMYTSPGVLESSAPRLQPPLSGASIACLFRNASSQPSIQQGMPGLNPFVSVPRKA